MTEEEAKGKWCPMVRIAIGEGDYSTANRGWASTPEDLAQMNAHCIASACMMWRSESYPVPGSDTVVSERVGHGYCGLAGRS